MHTRHDLELFDDLIPGAVYRFLSRGGQVTLGVRDEHTVRLFGFGSGKTLIVDCQEWDRRITEADGGARIRHYEGSG
jgi:hypothetical protein